MKAPGNTSAREAAEDAKCQFSDGARGTSGERNPKLEIYRHLLKSKRKDSTYRPVELELNEKKLYLKKGKKHEQRTTHRAPRKKSRHIVSHTQKRKRTILHKSNLKSEY